MAYQLVYTSSPRGLTSGRTGFVTVARHREISSRLVTDLEKDSGYEWLTGEGTQPVVKRYCLYGGANARVLTRILPAGLDFTQRPCHLAHHLIVARSEPVLGTPLDWLTQWHGFRQEWKGEPQWLEEADQVRMSMPDFAVGVIPRWSWDIPGAQEFWRVLPTSARARPIFIYEPEQEKLLLGLWQWLLGQVSPARQWEISFTTLLQSAETADRYTWCAGWPGTAAAALARRESHRIVDLTSKHLSEGLQRLVLQGEETVASTPRRYVSSEPVENKPSIVRPVGRLSQSRATHEVLSKGPGSGPYMWAIWGLLAMAVVALSIGVWWWWPQNSFSQQPIPPTYVSDSPVPMLPIPGGHGGAIPETESANWESLWQQAVAANSVTAMQRFTERLRGHSEELEPWRTQAEIWQSERARIRQLAAAQLRELSRLEVVWDESQWEQHLADLPVEWREDLRKQKESWEQIRQWLQNIPVASLFLLTGQEDRWVLPAWRELQGLAGTTWSVESGVEGTGESTSNALSLELLQLDSQYRVVFDIFSVLRIQPYSHGRERWDVRMDAVPAEALRQYPELFVLQQSPVFRVKDSNQQLLFILRRMFVGQRWPDLAQTLPIWSAVEESPRGEAQLATWLSAVMARVYWVKSGEMSEPGHWVWENNRDEWLVASENEDQTFVLSRTKMTHVGNKSASGVSISNGQSRAVPVDWVLKNGPWKVRWSTNLPGEENILLILE